MSIMSELSHSVARPLIRLVFIYNRCLLPIGRSLPFVHPCLHFLAIQAYPGKKETDHTLLQINIFDIAKKRKRIAWHGIVCNVPVCSSVQFWLMCQICIGIIYCLMFTMFSRNNKTICFHMQCFWTESGNKFQFTSFDSEIITSSCQ